MARHDSSHALNRRSVCALLLALVGLVGCAGKTNPSFNVSRDKAKADIKRIERDGLFPVRPIVVLCGWADPFFAQWSLTRQLSDCGVGDDRVLGYSFVGTWSFDGCRAELVEAVQAKWPSDDPAWTVPVDVVGFSMGGLVARYAALPPMPLADDAETDTIDGEPIRRLRIGKLFTISTPHRGALLAALPTLDARVSDMRSGSAFLTYLDAHQGDAGYTLVPYVRLRDPIIGSGNAAPPDTAAWWVQAPALSRPHQDAFRDPRIVADILRRLRGDPPWTTAPAAPLPQ